MNTALFAISSLSLVVSGVSLAVLLKMASELQGAKAEVDALKAKVNKNATVVKTALSQLDI